MTAVNDLTDAENQKLVLKMKEILRLSDQLTQAGSSPAFQIYKLSRDVLDMISFDQVSREMIARLTHGGEYFEGHEVDAGVLAFMKNNQKINAINLMRELTGMGIREAKDWVEAYMDQRLNHNW
jgi:ribosomal protein L7/L12